jgi:hypothetical protein
MNRHRRNEQTRRSARGQPQCTCRAQQDRHSATGLCRQLQATQLAHAESLLPTQNGSHSRTTQRLNERVISVVPIGRMQHDATVYFQSPANRTGQIKLPGGIDNHQRFLLVANVRGHFDAQRPRPAAMDCGKELHKNPTRQPTLRQQSVQCVNA